MPLDVQAKILRVIQERELVKIGGHVKIPLNIRIIAATNQDLKSKVAKGDIREDLYYRLNVIPLTITNLKVRLEDIPLIISHKLKSLEEVYQIDEKTIYEKIIRKLYLYDCHGNIRELFYMLERLFVLTSGRHIYYEDFIKLIDLQPSYLNEELFNHSYGNSKQNYEMNEVNTIKQALADTKGNKTD